jgi:hypothetical protein
MAGAESKIRGPKMADVECLSRGHGKIVDLHLQHNGPVKLLFFECCHPVDVRVTERVHIMR